MYNCHIDTQPGDLGPFKGCYSVQKYCLQLARIFEAGQCVQNIKIETKAINTQSSDSAKWLGQIKNKVQSTPALRTPRYYGDPAITDSSKIPGESYRRLTEINSRYHGLSLLRTYGHFIRSQRHNFIVFSLVIADTEQYLGIFAHISSLFFSAF